MSYRSDRNFIHLVSALRMVRILKFIFCIVSMLLYMSILSGHTAARAESSKIYGMALREKAKYGLNTAKFPYAAAEAKKGGTLNLGSYVSFDSLNPFITKGTTPPFLNYAGEEDFVFETLMSRGLEEVFAKYSLIAERMELAKDELSVTIHLNKKAKFSDGIPLTSDDVVFSMELQKSTKVLPALNNYYQDVKSCKALDKYTVKCDYLRKNPELHILIAELHILPKHIYGASGKDFEKDFSLTAVGSGPYVVDSYELGKFVTYKRNKNYWGNDEKFNIGRANFDIITIKFYRDMGVFVEGFKAGDFDFYYVTNSKQWAVDLTGDKFTKNYIVKNFIPHAINLGVQGFEMNQRRPLFKDVRVRKALALALDFDSMNNSLFFSQYTRHQAILTTLN